MNPVISFSLKTNVVPCRLILFLIFSIILSTSYVATLRANEQPLHIVSFEDFAPLSYLEEGKVVGVYNDIAKEAFLRAGYSINISLVPWKRGLSEIEKGTAIAMLGPFYNEQRAGFSRFILSAPLFEISSSFFTVKDSDLYTSYTGIESLKGRRVGIVRGFFLTQEFEDAKRAKLFEAVPFNGINHMTAALAKGWIDGFVYNHAQAVHKIKETAPLAGIRPVGPPIYRGKKTYIAVSKKALLLQKAGFFEALEKACNEMITDGTIDRIYKMYGVEPQELTP